MIKDFETYISEGRLGRIMTASKAEGEDSVRKEDRYTKEEQYEIVREYIEKRCEYWRNRKYKKTLDYKHLYVSISIKDYNKTSNTPGTVYDQIWFGLGGIIDDPSGEINVECDDVVTSMKDALQDAIDSLDSPEYFEDPSGDFSRSYTNGVCAKYQTIIQKVLEDMEDINTVYDIEKLN